MESFEQRIQLQRQLEKYQVEKSIEGTEAFYIEQDLMKGVSQEEVLEKAKSGIYSNTAQNRKAGRVGQKYGSEKKESQSKHISDMSHEEKIQTAKKLGIANADTLSKKELNKQLIDKHVEKQLNEFKNKKKTYSFEEVLSDPEGKKLIEAIEHLDTKRADHKELYQGYKKQLKDKFGYNYMD